MPKVTIWIKEEDYPIWQTIADRPDFIHKAIRKSVVKRKAKV